MLKNELNHIAFIMDGNGRWAKNKKLARTQGHYEGAKRISEIILGCKKHKISMATFFAFSTENWSRPKLEVNFLIKLLQKNLIKKNLKWFLEHDIKLNVIGFENNSLKYIWKKIQSFCNNTNNCKSIIVNICFNYSSQLEIIESCKKLVSKNLEINQQNFEQCLWINKPVDLLIRTSGEQRISNFLLYQIAYAEIIFENTFWPDYKINVLEKNINQYYNRNRRFGAIDE